MLPTRRRFSVAYIVLALVGCMSLGVFVESTRGTPHTPLAEAAVKTPSAPTAREFAETFVRTANAYSSAHGKRARIERAHCVQASPGHYMCSYAVLRAQHEPECHVVQARWTPGELSSFAVTLAGRAARCGSLREALRSLA